jgi:hypothetical protein
MLWLRRYRWWILLPILFAVLVPTWEWLGVFLRYDLFPAPDPEPPRFDSAVIAIPYYLVWYLIMFLILLPGSLITPFLGVFFPHSISYRISPALIGFLYCTVFFLLRRSILSVIRRLRSSRDVPSKV